MPLERAIKIVPPFIKSDQVCKHCGAAHNLYIMLENKMYKRVLCIRCIDRLGLQSITNKIIP